MKNRIFFNTLFGAFVGISFISILIYYFVPTACAKYVDKLQIPLFTGFLTLGSFLLTLKTFIIVQLKDKLYDVNEKYLREVAEKTITGSSANFYSPLERLAELLITAVILAITTALLQLTLGYIGNQLSSAICISFAIITLLLVFFAWWQIKKNIHDLFTVWEKMKKPVIEAEKQKILANAETSATN